MLPVKVVIKKRQQRLSEPHQPHCLGAANTQSVRCSTHVAAERSTARGLVVPKITGVFIRDAPSRPRLTR